MEDTVQSFSLIAPNLTFVIILFPNSFYEKQVRICVCVCVYIYIGSQYPLILFLIIEVCLYCRLGLAQINSRRGITCM